MTKHISRFNPQRMTEEEILELATGREKVLEGMISHMKSSLKNNSNQHFVFYGPRGIGKSFFTRLLKVTHDNSSAFKKSTFIQFPEEQSNIAYVADILDMLSTKLEGGLFSEVKPRWGISDHEWAISKKRLKTALKEIKGKEHVFFTMENLQDFIPKLDDTENGRFREFLSDFSELSLIGSSLRPDIDNSYNKKLFQVFKKINLEPWNEQNFIDYYRKKVSFRGKENKPPSNQKITEQKIRAIAKFSGGSPRLAVILNSLILDDDIQSTMDIMNSIIDELTPYYQDLTKDIPQRSKILFDLLIRLKENVTQSQLASQLNPAQEQSTIARSFNWLVENFYVTSIKQKKGNVKHYYVRDRLYVLYYQNREVLADQEFSFVETFVEFLTEFYTQNEWKDRIAMLTSDNKWSKVLVDTYSTRLGLNLSSDMDLDSSKNKVLEKIEIKRLENLFDQGDFKEVLVQIEQIKNKKHYHWALVGMSLFSMGNYPLAIIAFRQSITLQPMESYTHFSLGLAYIKNLEFGNATSEIKIANELSPNEPEIQSALGFSLINIGLMDEAHECIQKALKQDPENSNYNHNMGLYFDKLGNLDKAINYLLKAIKPKPKNAIIYFNLAVQYFHKTEFKKAIENFKIAISLDGNDPGFYYNLGKSYFELLNFPEALDNYKKALELNPTNSDVFNDIGVLYFEQGKLDEAEKWYKKALTIQPKNYTYIANLFEIYLITNELGKIEVWLKERTNEFPFEKLLTYSLVRLLDTNRSRSFEKVVAILDWLKNLDQDLIADFFSNLSVELSKEGQTELLQDIVNEIQANFKLNDAIEILIQTWQYLLNPNEIDLVSLHPDARVAAEAVLEDSKK